MMASLFILFVIELWLNSKTGGHSHGGPTGEGVVAGTPHHHGHPSEQKHPSPVLISQDQKLPRPTPMAWDEKVHMVEYERKPFDEKSFDGRTLRSIYEDDENQAHRLSTMPAWFIAFYEQYVRQHTEIMDMLRPKGNSFKLTDEEKAHATVTEYAVDDEEDKVDPDVLRRMSTNITLLEGGILFHSVFVGMTVSITVEGFAIFLVAISFHQMFEGLGLGSRIAAVPYPRTSYKPWFLVLAFGTTAPIGQAIGLLTRNSYDPDSALGLIIVGVFNAM